MITPASARGSGRRRLREIAATKLTWFEASAGAQTQLTTASSLSRPRISVVDRLVLVCTRTIASAPTTALTMQSVLGTDVMRPGVEARDLIPSRPCGSTNHCSLNHALARSCRSLQLATTTHAPVAIDPWFEPRRKESKMG
jgi:hypothetical protein